MGIKVKSLKNPPGIKKTGKSWMLGASFYILLRAWKILALWYESLNNVLNLGRQESFSPKQRKKM
jgi:hypothetical protein